MKTIVHVNQHVIRSNLKTGAKDHVLTVKQGRKNTYASRVDLTGPSTVVYSPDKPLNCGARVWIETQSPVIIEEAENDTHFSSTCQLHCDCENHLSCSRAQ